MLVLVTALASCGPRRVVSPQPILSAPEGAGAWLFYVALEEGVEVPILGENLLAATEVALPTQDDGATVLTLTPKGLYARGVPIVATKEINGALHLMVEKGRATPEGEIPESIWNAMAAANPGFNALKSETHRGKRKVYLVADHRTSAASLAAIGLAGLFSGYSPPIVVGLSPDGTPRGMRLTGARPCPGVAPPTTPKGQSRVMGMDGTPSSIVGGNITQVGDCKGLERPDWFNRRLESIGRCFMEEMLRTGEGDGDLGTVTVVVDAPGNLQATSLRSPWAGSSPALQQCVHQSLQAMRAPVAKGACVLARGFRFEAGDSMELDVQIPNPSKPHYGRKIRWAFASMDTQTVLMDIHHEGSAQQCPTSTTGSLGWNVRGVELDRSRLGVALDGVDFDLDFLGLRVLGSVPLSTLVNTGNAWAKKGTRVGVSVRRF